MFNLKRKKNKKRKKRFFNKRLLSALKESEDIIQGKKESKRYKTFDDMLKDIS